MTSVMLNQGRYLQELLTLNHMKAPMSQLVNMKRSK